MEPWLIIVLIAIGVLVIVGGILVFKRKTDVVKKIFLPVIAVLGAVAGAGKLFGKSTSSIARENEAIKAELKDLQRQQDTLKEQHGARKAEHETAVEGLQDEIAASDEKAQTIKEDYETLKAGGVQEWVDDLSEQQKKEILDKNRPPDLEDQFSNPPDGN